MNKRLGATDLPMWNSHGEFLDRRRWLRITWVAALLLSAGIAFSLAMLSNWAEDRVRASLEARTYVERFYHAVVEAERAQRAYILTQDSDYFADYNHATVKLDQVTEQLRDIVARNNLESHAIDKLYALARERNAQLSGAIEVLHEDGFDPAVDAVRQNEIRRTTKQILDLIAAIDEEENRVLATREREARLLRGFLLAALVLIVGGTLLISTYSFEGERRMADRLAQLNRQLEQKVQERTRELDLERRRVEHLLADMSHRLGNNLSMISSYLLLQARRTKDDQARDALHDVHQRITSVASAQRRLQVNSATSAVDIQPYLETIIDDIRYNVVREGVSLELSSVPIAMRGDDAVALGVIINELITNALKYAFPDGQGYVSVAIAAKDDNVVLEVSDDGCGYGDAEGGLGSLVVQSMVSALGGRSARTSATGRTERPGTRLVVQFPLRRSPSALHLAAGQDAGGA